MIVPQTPNAPVNQNQVQKTPGFRAKYKTEVKNLLSPEVPILLGAKTLPFWLTGTPGYSFSVPSPMTLLKSGTNLRFMFDIRQNCA